HRTRGEVDGMGLTGDGNTDSARLIGRVADAELVLADHDDAGAVDLHVSNLARGEEDDGRDAELRVAHGVGGVSLGEDLHAGVGKVAGRRVDVGAGEDDVGVARVVRAGAVVDPEGEDVGGDGVGRAAATEVGPGAGLRSGRLDDVLGVGEDVPDVVVLE